MFKWSRQVILLTGGTGSFGQAFTQWLLKTHPPKALRIFSRDEYKQFLMRQKFSHPCLRYFIGDVRDKDRLKRAMDEVTLVIHAAAMKQIEACEYNPSEAINTNIFGTMNVINTAIDANVQRILGIITDKAVAPVNLYGATKLCMEKLMIQGNVYAGYHKTKISCVRYGNVAGSRGSVIPLFLKQMQKGKFTVTHKAMTRFWITLEEAINFVSQSIENIQGGEVYIPKMPSFKILDLIKALSPKAKKVYIGIRPGEKIHEDLISIHEANNVFESKTAFVLLNYLTNSNYLYKKQYRSVNDDFSYNSGNNSKFLTSNELKQLINKLKIEAEI